MHNLWESGRISVKGQTKRRSTAYRSPGTRRLHMYVYICIYIHRKKGLRMTAIIYIYMK